MATATATPKTPPAANIPGAALRFPETEYATFTNVPIFREHKTMSVEGKELNFGREQLEMVCNRCNRRIAETGDYAAIVIGHTPDPSVENAPQPELVGYAGPFRMGTIGTGDRQCWAILADFHVMRDCLAKVRKHPRRSPELALEDEYSEMFLDPIALLGAEVPRLDLGLVTGAQGSDGASEPAPEGTARKLYSFTRNGRRVEKYAMAACAMPAAGNVHTPATKYAAAAPGTAKAASTLAAQPGAKPAVSTPAKNIPKQTGATSMLTPEDISAVVEAFLSTDAGQFLVSEMEAKKGTNAIVEPGQEPPAEALAPETPEPPATEPGAEVPIVAEEPIVTEPAATPPPAEKPPEIPAAPAKPHAEPDGDEATKKYAAACKSADDMKDEEVEKYLSKRWANHPKWKKYAAECGSIDPDGKGGAAPKPGEILADTPDPAGNGAAPPAEKPADSGTEPAKPTQMYSRLQSELQAVKGKLAAEEATRRHVERYSRMQGMSAEFIMDPDEEMDLTRDMNDQQFDRHCDRTIREHYQRNPVGLPWAAPADSMSTNRDPSHPGNTPISKETSDKQAAVATERYMRKRHAGEKVEFAEVLEEVKAGR